MGKDMNKISAEDLEKGIKFITPKFIAKWPWLTKPDTKFNEGGVFRVTAVLDPNIPEDLEFLELIDKVGEAAYEQAKMEIEKEKNAAKRNQKLKQLVLAPVSQEELDENGEATGKVELKFKSYATRRDKEGNEVAVSIPLCDAHRNRLDPENTPIGNGSELRISGMAKGRYVAAQGKAYVTLYISAVQVVKLVPYLAGDGEFSGFSDEEGGYVNTTSTDGGEEAEEDYGENKQTFAGSDTGDF